MNVKNTVIKKLLLYSFLFRKVVYRKGEINNCIKCLVDAIERDKNNIKIL